MVSTLCRRTPLTPKVRIEIGFAILLPALALSCRTQPQPEKVAVSSPTPQATVNLKPIEIPSPVYDKPYPGTGVVTIINLKEGWVEIKHEEIKGLMPAMTMEFWARPPSILKGVRTGDKVDFVIVETHKGEYVTKLKRVARVP